MNAKRESLLVLLSTTLTITVNALANILPFNGQTSAEVSNHYFTSFTPAGYAFAIWSVIYLGLLAFSIYQALPSQLQRFQELRTWVIVSNVCNALWLPLFHYEVFVVSILVIGSLLYSLQRINASLDRQAATDLSTILMARRTFGIYFGWVSIATIANVAVALTAHQWDGFGLSHEHWAVVMLIVGLLVGLGVQSRIQSYAQYLLVFAWAYWAIHEGQSDLLVQQVAQLGAFVALGAIVVRFVRNQRP